MKTAFPPRWANRFLEWYCRPDLLEEIQGDTYELFYRTAKQNELKAKAAFVWNVVRFFRWKNIRKGNEKYYSTQRSLDMLKNYLKIGIRNLMRYKAFSFINVIGLAIGLTSFLLISAFIYDELSYDKYPSNYKNIYRVGLQLAQNGGVDDYPKVDNAVAPGMKNAFPEILESARITTASDYVRFKDNQVKEESMVFADSTVLKIFSIPLLEGNPNKALVEPNSIVISKEFAKKYFGDKPALGEVLTFRENGLMKVTGVFDKIPDNSHFHFDVFISMTTGHFTKMRQTWSNVGYYSYVVLNEHVDPRQLEAKFPQLVEKYVVPEVQADMGVSYADASKTVGNLKFYLMSIKDIHLHSHTKYEIEANGDINNVYIFGALAFFILLLACINFMNLSTASSAKRALEIGVRKVMGSFKSQLMAQFLLESTLLSMMALVLAFFLSYTLLPLFNQLTGKHLDVFFFLSPPVLSTMIAFGLVVGILAGFYPALFLSSVQPLRVLKSNSSKSAKRGGLRSALVILQFTISTALIIATIVAYQQLRFMQNIKLGYDKDQIIVIENAGLLHTNEIPFKQKLKMDHRVVNVTNASVPIGSAGSFGGTEVFPKGSNTYNIHITIFTMDYDYLETLGIGVKMGRNFSKEFLSDSLGQNVIINETAMRDLGWNENNVIGNTIVRTAQQQYKVVGVINDFHYTSAKDKIAPLMILYHGYSPSMLVKVNTNEMQSFISDLGAMWSKFSEDVPFSYYFLDAQFARLYKAEQTIEKLFIVFMVIAVLIASLGLYGLSTYSAEQRVKEMGIRKVLGSSVRQIVVLQSKEFLLLVVIAIVVAAPLAWWTMHQWLQNFGYRIEINGWIVVLAALSAMVIAIVTVSFQAIKTATANPIISLKAE